MKPPALNANESPAYLSLGPLRLTNLQRYGLAVLSVGIALGVGLLLEYFHFRVPSALLLLFAVALSSWRGGRGPAVLAAILSVIAFYWYFVEPVRTIHIYSSEIPYFITVISFAVLLSWFGTIRRRVEADLREQAALLNLTHDTVFAMDMEGVIKYWNRGAEEQYGWTAEQAMGRSVHDLLKTALPAPLEEIKAKVTRTGRWEGEILHTRKDGTQLVVASRWALQRGERGAPVAILETSNDITERKRAEEALRRSEAYLSEAQRLTYSGSWAWDPRRDEMHHCSDETFGIYGFDPREAAPAIHEFLQRVHPEDRVRLRESSLTGALGKKEQVLDYRIVLPDGTLKHLHSTRHPVLNAAGEVVEVVGTVVDVTERNRAEEALRESEARFRTFVEHATDAFFLIDDEAKVLDVNRQACENLGYTREELIGMRPYDFDPNVDFASLRSLGERLDTGVVCSFETCHRRKDGTLFPVEVRLRRFRQGGHSLSLALTRDITGRKRAEAERDRLRQLEADLAHINRVSMMGELAASVAHEVNQPLSGVVSNASAGLRWLAGDVPNLEEAREGLRRIVRDGKRAGEVIARIRALTRKAATPTGKLDLNETIGEVLALIGDEARRKSVIVRTQFANDLSPVSGDRVQLQQVVLNLVMNAMEAMSAVDERARALEIATRNVDPDQVQVTVQDSGIGINPQTINRIFDSFYTTKPGGMGMGLSISRSILQAHGGRIWATANDGRGTSFHFTLPKHHEEGSNAEAAGI